MEKINNIFERGVYESKQPQERLFQADPNPELFRTSFLEIIHEDIEIYVVDEFNQGLINQLYLWMIGSENFKGDLFKGILILGKVGCGKTLLMNGFLYSFAHASRKVINLLHAKNLHTYIKEKGVSYYSERPLFIDDIGKEPTEAKDFGNASKPFEDLIAFRSEKKCINFGTSNYALEDMPYPLHTIDRMKEMFNIIIMPGESRRK